MTHLTSQRSIFCFARGPNREGRHSNTTHALPRFGAQVGDADGLGTLGTGTGVLNAWAEGPRALTRPSGPYNWPRPMFSARERGFGPEEADVSFSWPNPRFSARERAYYADGPEGRFGAQVGDDDGFGTLGTGTGVLHAWAEGPRALTRPSGPYNWPRLMFSARERGFGPEEADFSYSWPNPRFTARERGFAYNAGTSGPEGRFGAQVVTLVP